MGVIQLTPRTDALLAELNMTKIARITANSMDMRSAPGALRSYSKNPTPLLIIVISIAEADSEPWEALRAANILKQWKANKCPAATIFTQELVDAIGDGTARDTKQNWEQVITEKWRWTREPLGSLGFATAQNAAEVRSLKGGSKYNNSIRIVGLKLLENFSIDWETKRRLYPPSYSLYSTDA